MTAAKSLKCKWKYCNDNKIQYDRRCHRLLSLFRPPWPDKQASLWLSVEVIIWLFLQSAARGCVAFPQFIEISQTQRASLAFWALLDDDQEEKRLRQTSPLQDESLHTVLGRGDNTEVRHTLYNCNACEHTTIFTSSHIWTKRHQHLCQG